MYKEKSEHPRGAIAILTLLGVSIFALAVVINVSSIAVSGSKMAGGEADSEKTFYAVEAGINEALYKLAKTPSSSSFSSNSDGFTTVVTITPDAGFPTSNDFQGTVKTQTTDSTGKIRIIQIRANTSLFGGSFIYGAQTDIGGIGTNASNSTINGDIFSNGSVAGNNGQQIIVNGNVTVATGSGNSASNLTVHNGDVHSPAVGTSVSVDGGHTIDNQAFAPKNLPIGSADISNWHTQIQAACGASCISEDYDVSNNLQPTANLQSGGSLTAYTTYYYKIAAVVSGFETITSNEVSASISHHGSNKTIHLAWNGIGGSSYNIYRTTIPGVYTSPALIANTSNIYFNDNGVTPTSGTTTCPNTCLGWQKINGDLNVNSDLTLTGNIWVTGNVTISNGRTLKIDSGLSANSLMLLVDQRVSTGNNANLCGSDCTNLNPTNFLLVISTHVDTDIGCSFVSGQPSINAQNNSKSVIFAAPFGMIDVKKATINASASRSLCLEAQVTVNFVSSIGSLFVPSLTRQPIRAVLDTWQEK